MDHSGHSGHSGHAMPGMEMPSDQSMCSMNMLWNSQVADVCVVFSSWHISGPLSMAVSCLLITLISIAYAYLLNLARSFDRRMALSIYATASPGTRQPPAARRESSLIPPIPAGYQSVEAGGGAKGDRIGVVKLSLQARMLRAALYALCVALSFWLMLVAMTYNTFLFSSIVVGAFLGHLLYEGEIDVGALTGQNGKGLACH